MPVVDLSNIGLEGQQAFATRMATLAQADQLKASAAQTRLENVEKEREQLFADAVSRMQTIAKGESTGSGANLFSDEDSESAAAPIERMADMAMQMGAVESARKLANTGSEIRNRESTIEQNEIENDTKRLDNIVKYGNAFAQTVAVAKNQAEWIRNLDEFGASGVVGQEQIEAMKAQPWSEDLMAFYREKGISAAQQAQMELQQANADRAERAQAAAGRRADRAYRLAEKVYENNVRHQRVMEKNGGKDAPSAATPTEQDVKMARTALTVNGPFRNVENKDSAVVTQAAQYIASQTKAILKDNKALTYDQAQQQAILRAMKDGVINREESGSMFTNDKVLFGAGLSPPAAKPLPKSASAMVKGHYYVTSKGIVQWDGTRGIPVD